MSGENLAAYSTIGFFFGISLFVKGLLWMKQKRLIENIPTSKIRSLAMGLVEVFGEVVPIQKIMLKSPLSNKDCVYYKYAIEEHRSSGKHSRWVTVKSGEDRVHFFLQDETGRVLIDPSGAEIDIPLDFEFNSGFMKDPPESVRQFLKNNGLSFESFLGLNKTMRYREYFIEPMDKLYIMGTAGDNPLVEEATAAQSTADIMIQKGENEKNYYISDRTEKELLESLKWKSAGGVIGGAVLAVACLAIMLIYLNLL